MIAYVHYEYQELTLLQIKACKFSTKLKSHSKNKTILLPLFFFWGGGGRGYIIVEHLNANTYVVQCSHDGIFSDQNPKVLIILSSLSSSE